MRAWGADTRLQYRWADQINLDEQGGFDKVRFLLETYRPSWVIFDSFIRFTRRSLIDADAMSALYMTRYRPLREMVDGGFLLLAHLRKRSREAPNGPGQRLFGSVDLRNSCDAHIAMQRSGQAVTVTHEATRWDELFPPFKLRLEAAGDHSTARLIYEESIGNSEAAGRDSYSQVREWLRERGGSGMLRREIVARFEATGLSEEAADKRTTRVLKHFREGGEIAQRTDGNAKRIWLSECQTDGEE